MVEAGARDGAGAGAGFLATVSSGSFVWGEKLNEADNGRPNPFRALPDYIMQAASRVTAERVFQRFYLLPRVQR